MAMANVYFLNAAPFPVEVLQLDEKGVENSHGLIQPGTRRMRPSYQGDAWRARAVRPGHAGDRRLLAEHVVGPVPIEDCECPPVDFHDCSVPHFKGPRWTPPDPVAFVNKAAQPVDLFYWNGTCEEIVSWTEVGGLQPVASLLLESTQGHAFRARAAHSRRFLSQHVLADVVVRACDDDALRERAADAAELREDVRELRAEGDALRELLSEKLSALALALAAPGGNATATATTAAAVDVAGAAAPALASLASMKLAV